MDLEHGKCWDSSKKDSWKTIFILAYQSLGVVYGDLGISPLYVYKSTFAEDIQHSNTNEEIFGALSFVFWTLTLVPLFKYVFIVLRADDNGEGGTFAMYSSICRHAKVSLLPNRQVADEALSTYKLEQPPEKNSSRVKMYLEKHKFLHTALLILVLLGTCMVIGDGLLTPAISVFSAVSGLEFFMSKEHHQYAVIPITCFIIVCLFALQHYGTHRVGFLFAPVVLIWLLCISALGLYNIIHWNSHVYQALSPYYMFKFLKKTRKRGWMSLGGILLCITGSEAMCADLGHFSYAAIQIAFTCLVYPALILAYMGQAAYLSKHHETNYQISFFVSVPESVRWPVLVVAILASIVGSQAIISGTFSIINQSQSLGCFPRVKVVHTSDKIHGQIYIPEINWLLMILCIAVTIGFRDTKHIGNASGLAVMTVMLVTTCLTALVIILCWHKPPILALCFLLFFGSIELLYFSASLTKFREGAWLPILLALFLTTIMFVWHYATIKKYEFDLHNKVSLEWLLALGPSLGIARVPGIGLVFTDLTSGIPANFSRFVTNLPAFHRILVFVCVKSVPVPHVPPAERYLVGRVGPAAHRSYRCIVRYGYRDVHQDVDSFESELVDRLADFICYDWYKTDRTNLYTDDAVTSRSNESTSDGRLAVIGTVSLSGAPAYEIEETLQPASVSGGFTSVESVTDVIEMEPVRAVQRRVRFAIDDQSDTDAQSEINLELSIAAFSCEGREQRITMGFGALHLSPSPSGFASNVGFPQNLSSYGLNRVSTLRVHAKKEEQDPKKSTQSLFSNITEALDFSQVRSGEDAQLLEDARKATRSGSQMSREQYGALRRKIGGTYKDFFKSYIDVDGGYVEEGWVDKTCKVCKKDTRGEPRQVDKLGRYVHVACLEKANSGNFFTRLFSR